jgi:hypothetical protein
MSERSGDLETYETTFTYSRWDFQQDKRVEEVVRVRVSVNLERLANSLVLKALKARRIAATAIDGAVRVTIVR